MGNNNIKEKLDFGESARQYSKRRVQYKLALKLLKYLPRSNSGHTRVLDVGCGMGEFTDFS